MYKQFCIVYFFFYCVDLLCSGSGKTSLLQALGGRETSNVTGEVYFNNQLASQRSKKHLGFVLQFDIFCWELTIRQVLDFSAAMRMDSALSAKDRKMVVDELVTELCLTHVVDCCIATVSGGHTQPVLLCLYLALFSVVNCGVSDVFYCGV